MFVVLCYHAKLGLRQRTPRLVEVRWVIHVVVTRGSFGHLDVARLRRSQCCSKWLLLLDVSLVLGLLVWGPFILCSEVRVGLPNIHWW